MRKTQITLNLKQFLRDFNENKVYYDWCFQRRDVWTYSIANRFFEDFSKNWTLNDIIVLDIVQCIAHCVASGDFTSKKYFEDILKQGYTYISLDGQNRSKALEKMYNNQITLSGYFEDVNGDVEKITNSFFKDLPPEIQLQFELNSEITVKVIGNATRTSAPKIFKGLNGGMPLNGQEMRQSTSTPIADVVRKFSQEYSEFLKRIMTEARFRRMEDDEMIAKTLMVLMKNYRSQKKEWGLSSSDIDEFYEMGEGYNTLEDTSCPYLSSELARAKGILDLVATTVVHQKNYPKSKQVPRSPYWALVFACEYVWDNGLEIGDHAKFFRRLKNIDNEIAVDSETAYAKARKNAVLNGLDPKTVPEQNFYHKWQGLPHQSKSRKQRASRLISVVSKNLKSLTLRKKADTVSNAA